MPAPPYTTPEEIFEGYYKDTAAVWTPALRQSMNYALNQVLAATLNPAMAQANRPEPTKVRDVELLVRRYKISPDGYNSDLVKLTGDICNSPNKGKDVFRNQDVLNNIIQSSAERLARGIKNGRAARGRKGVKCEGCDKVESSEGTTLKLCAGVRLPVGSL